MYKIRRTIPPYIRRRKIKPGVAILIIHPEIRPVGLARFLYYVARVTSRVKKEGYRWQSLWRVRQAQDVTKCTEAPRRLPNCVAIAETSHSSWRCTLHGILPAFFFPGEGGGGYCVSSSRSRGFESLADISDGVQSLPAAFAVEAWIIKKEGEKGEREELKEFFGKGS